MFGSHHGFAWVHLSEPTHEEIAEIIQRYNVHAIVEEDLRTGNTQDKVALYDEHIFVVLHFPKYDLTLGKYYSNELNLIIGKDFLVTVATYNTKGIDAIKDMYDDYIQHPKKHPKTSHNCLYWVYKLLDGLYDKTLSTLGKFVRDVHFLEEQLFLDKKLNSKLLGDLLIKRRNSIYLKHLLWPQQEVLEELQQAIKDFYKEEMDVYYDDLQYKFTKVQHAIYTIGENVESLANTYNALANMQTNSVISVLTVLTVMIGTMTLITGLYGMNVPLPGQGNVYIFVVILASMLFLGIAGLLVAKRKGLR